MKNAPFTEKYLKELNLYYSRRSDMPTVFQNYSILNMEKASELGKTLSKGGRILSDNAPAFSKKFGK